MRAERVPKSNNEFTTLGGTRKASSRAFHSSALAFPIIAVAWFRTPLMPVSTNLILSLMLSWALSISAARPPSRTPTRSDPFAPMAKSSGSNAKQQPICLYVCMAPGSIGVPPASV